MGLIDCLKIRCQDNWQNVPNDGKSLLKSSEQNLLTFVRGKILGSGSFGTVYTAKCWINQNKEIPVAFKTLKEEKQEDLKKELEVMRQLDHVFIIKCFGIYEHEYERGLVLELAECTLEDYVYDKLENVPWDPLGCKTICCQITIGLAFIHSKSIIHGDLKPANILLKRSPEANFILVKIADFGCAKLLRPGKEEVSNTLHGTEDYMAPELLMAMKLKEKITAANTFASDIYALGITIGVTNLKGKHPFGEVTDFRLILMRDGCDPPYLGNLGWDLMDLILQLMKKEPTERPNASLVIYHPYFSLTNEKTRAHFQTKMFQHFNAIPRKVSTEHFDERNIQTWLTDSVKKRKCSRGNAVIIETWKETEDKKIQETLLCLEGCHAEYVSKICHEVIITTPNVEKLCTRLRQHAPKNDSSECIAIMMSEDLKFASYYFWNLLHYKTGHHSSSFISNEEPYYSEDLSALTECYSESQCLSESEEKNEQSRLKNVLDEVVFDAIKAEAPRRVNLGIAYKNPLNGFKDADFFSGNLSPQGADRSPFSVTAESEMVNMFKFCLEKAKCVTSLLRTMLFCEDAQEC